MKPENAFKHRIVIPALRQVPNCWFFINESFLAIRGLPDIVGVVNGTFFAWEIKHSRQEAMKDSGRIVMQKFIIDKIKKCGGIAEIVYPDNIEQCIEQLRSVNNGI